MPPVTRRTVLTVGGAAALSGLLLPAGVAGAADPGAGTLPPEDGYDLWLRYRPVGPSGRRRDYLQQLRSVVRPGSDPLLRSAAAELRRGLTGLLDRAVPETAGVTAPGSVVLGTPAESSLVREHVPGTQLAAVGPEGYLLRSVTIDGHATTVVAANTARGVLYGAFHLLRLVQTHQSVHPLDVRERPANPLRIVDHWDNLDGTVERGYAGRSIFQWHDLPTLVTRYTDYARTLASVGINGTVVNNVNANPQFLSSQLLPGLAALAGALREWGVRFHLSANYASPMALTQGDATPITTADPFDARVQQWWRDKVEEIYDLIPDFGGFLVKANSEGQPGPLNYGRTHADGANMLADIVAPHDGHIMWRSFVHEGFGDWAEYQHRVFAPLDGDFADNVAVQTKNGPIDFQVREPVNPLFGAMPNTNQMIELQITQEYTGHSTHLCYLVPQWKEVLGFNTHMDRGGPTVASIVDGTAYGQSTVGFAGVINFGSDRDWTGHQLGAANTHGFARLAWNPRLSAEEIAQEWVRMTFGSEPTVVNDVSDVLLRSWRAYEDYTSPLGTGYITYPLGDHFEPDPRSTLNLSHYTDAAGTGFDRTVATGTGYTGLYSEHWARVYESLDSVPEELLLFMHKVPYEHRLHSGSTVIQHIYDTHFDGLQDVHDFRQQWQRLARWIDERRHADVAATFDDHVAHATKWRDVMVSFYFSYARILDERRSWLQAEVDPDSTLLLGGWPGRVAVDVGNATPDALTVGAELVVPDDTWSVSPGQQQIGSTEFGRVTVGVQPPLTSAIARLDVELSPGSVPSLGGAGTEFVVTPVARRCHMALDAGTSGSPLVPGYDRLTPTMAWDPARGYGWVGSPPQERDRGGGLDALRRDFVGDYPAHTLRLAVPPGQHEASILVGDGGPASWPTFVSVDGERVAESPYLPGNAFTWVTFPLDGGAGGREVDLTFDSIPNQFWHLCALVVPDPASALPEIVVTGTGAEPVWFTGHPTDVHVSVANTTQDRAIDVTVEVEVPEGWQAPAVTHTLAAGAERTFPVQVTAAGDPALTTVDVTVTSDAEVGDAQRSLEVLAVPSGADVPLTFDAGGEASPVLSTFARLAPTDAWDAERGYGWVTGVPDSRDRNLLDVLRRDLVLGRDEPYVLRVAVPPGRHTAHLLTGDAYAPSGTTTVLEGGAVLASSGAEIIPQGDFRWFSFDLDGGTSGRTADLELRGSQRDRYWRLVALVLQPSPDPLPRDNSLPATRRRATPRRGDRPWRAGPSRPT